MRCLKVLIQKDLRGISLLYGQKSSRRMGVVRIRNRKSQQPRPVPTVPGVHGNPHKDKIMNQHSIVADELSIDELHTQKLEPNPPEPEEKSQLVRLLWDEGDPAATNYRKLGEVLAKSGDLFSRAGYGCWFSSAFKGHPHFSMIAKMDNSSEPYTGIDIQTEPDGTIGTHLMGDRSKSPGSYIRVTSREQFTENFWHHVFVTYDGSSTARGVTIYIDGHPVAVNVIVDSLSGGMRTPVPLRIGMRHVFDSFQGKIDDVRFYNRQLSDSEVSQVFNVGLHSLANIQAEQRTPEQQAVLSAAFPSRDELVMRLNGELSAAEVKLSDARWEAVRRWYVNGQGQTMVVTTNPSLFSNSEIDYDFAIARHETTVGAWIETPISENPLSCFASRSSRGPLCQYT